MRLTITITPLNEGAEGYAPSIEVDTEDYASQGALLTDIAKLSQRGDGIYFKALHGPTYVIPHALLARSLVTITEVPPVEPATP